MKRLALIVTAAVLGGAVGAASMTAAVAVTVPLESDFGVLLPGQSASASAAVDVPTDSVVAEAEWIRVTGPGVWDARLCAATTCTPIDALAGTAVPAGSYRVVIDVTMPADAPAAATAARGRISLMESIELPLTDGGLALTGGTTPWIATAIGAMLLSGGTALLLRRRDRREQAPS